MRVFFWLSMLVLIGWNSTMGPGYCTQTLEADEIFSRLQSLVAEYYPEATCEKEGEDIRFKYNTRMFMMHHQDKMGNWQNASPQEGPNRGGMLCDVGRGEGHYFATSPAPTQIPQRTDYYYFKAYRIAPYCTKSNSHLYAVLVVSNNVQPEFVERFSQLISSYGDEK